MAYGLLVKKLNMEEKRYLSSKEIRAYCAILGMRYYDAIRYLTRHKYLLTILRGTFYKPRMEERKLGIIAINHLDALAEALNKKKVNWYFGLETALKLNSITHEFFAVDTVITDAIHRAEPVQVLGNRVHFIKVKKALFRAGIKHNGTLRYADVEKTILDTIYLSRYRGSTEAEIKNSVTPLLAHCSKEKLRVYAKYYNAPVEGFVETL